MYEPILMELTTDELCRLGVPADGRDGAPCCWIAPRRAAEPQSLRHGCGGRGGPVQQHPHSLRRMCRAGWGRGRRRRARTERSRRTRAGTTSSSSDIRAMALPIPSSSSSNLLRARFVPREKEAGASEREAGEGVVAAAALRLEGA
jgi:hypothetical protein